LDLKTQLETFFTDIKDILKIIAPICAFIGLIGAGIIYLGSSWPVIGKMKRDNPDLMNNMFIGMAVLLAAGTVSSLIVFA
jgi:phage-related minor tail protein